MIGERPQTRSQQRLATRAAILEATAACLVEDGYGSLTTRRVAERAGIAQSTVMHHFATREALLVEAVGDLAMQLAEEALEGIDLAALRSPRHREAVLDQAWVTFTSPPALAAIQLWVAAWNEPELASTLRDLEIRVGAILMTAANTLFPEQAGDPDFPAHIDAAVAVIRGLLIGLPIWGKDEIDARWEAIKPLVIAAAAQILDRPSPSGERPQRRPASS